MPASPPPTLSGDDIDAAIIASGAPAVRMVLWIMFAGTAVNALIESAAGANVLNSATPYILVFCLAGFWRLRAGSQRSALRFILWGFVLLSLASGFLVAGTRTAALYASPLVVMIAGWMLGRRQAWQMAATFGMVVTLLGWLELTHRLPPPLPRGPLTYAVLLIFMAAIGAWLGTMSLSRFRQEFVHSLELTEELKKKLADLAASEQRFQKLFYVNPLPSTITDDLGCIREANGAWLKLTGRTREECIGHTGLELELWTDRDWFEQAVAAIRRDGRLEGMPGVMQSRQGPREMLVHSERCEIAGTPMAIHVLYDQTERLQLERHQRNLNEELERRIEERSAQLREAQESLFESERLASLGSMVAGISHELNTPIGNALLASDSLAQKSRALADDVTSGKIKKSSLLDYVAANTDISELIKKSVERASELVASFKRVAIDQASEQRRPFPLDQVVADMVLTLAPMLKRLPYTVHTDMPENVQCDSYPGPVSQVLSNLIQNAIVHAFDEREHGEIRIAARALGQEAVITVSDNGIGMSAATVARVFEPFFTTRLGKGGSGLGLSVSHRLATKVLSGSLRVESTEGHGSVFTLSFPLRAPFAA